MSANRQLRATQTTLSLRGSGLNPPEQKTGSTRREAAPGMTTTTLPQPPQWLGDLAQRQPLHPLIGTLRRRAATDALAQLRGDPTAPLSGVPAHLDLPPLILAAQLLFTFMPAAPGSTLQALLEGSAYLSTAQLNVALAFACAGWPAADVQTRLRDLEGDSHSVNPNRPRWRETFLRPLLELAALSDGLRALSGWPTGALDAAESAQWQAVPAQERHLAVRAALGSLRDLTLDPASRNTVLGWAARATGATPGEALRQWMILYPDTDSPGDLTDELRAALRLQSPGEPRAAAWLLRDAGHPLARLLPDEPLWHATGQRLPPAPLMAVADLETLTPQPARPGDHAESAGDLMLSLSTYLKVIAPPSTSRRALTDLLRLPLGTTPLARLLLLTLAGKLSSDSPWPVMHPDQAAVLSQWSALACSLAGIAAQGGVPDRLNALHPARTDHAGVLTALCRAGWPPAGLAVTLLAQMPAQLSRSNLNNPYTRTPRVDAEHGEALLAYWQALSVTSQVARQAETTLGERGPFELRRRVPASQPLPLAFAQACAQATHAALRARESTRPAEDRQRPA